jgi:hypothetical protein
VTIYLVSLRLETGVRLDAVSAGSAIEAAEIVSRRKKDVGGTIYSVAPEDRPEGTVDITVD